MERIKFETLKTLTREKIETTMINIAIKVVTILVMRPIEKVQVGMTEMIFII